MRRKSKLLGDTSWTLINNMNREQNISSTEKLSLARRILKNFLSLSIANITCKVLAFISTVYIARTLGADFFGIIGFSQAALVYFQLVINQGLDTYGTRETARHENAITRYMGNIISLRLILSVFAYGLLVIFALFIPKPMIIKMTLLILGLKLFELAMNPKWVFQGIEKMELIAASRIIQQILYLLCIFILVHNAKHVLRVATLQVVTAFVGTFILLGFYRIKLGRFRLCMDPPFWREIVRESIPMAASYFLIQLYVSFDVIILEFTHGEHTVGLYNATYKIITMINMFGIYYFMTLFPNVSRFYMTSKSDMQLLLAKSLRLCSLLAIPIAIGGTLLARPILELLFGASYAGGTLALRILIWNILVVWISLHYGNTLIACNRQNKYLVGVSLGAFSNIFLNLIFIPKYGMTAAALTTIFSEIIVLSFMYRELQKIISLRFFSSLPKPLLAAAAMGVIVQVLNGWNVFARIALGFLVYVPLLYLAGGFSRRDVTRLRILLSGRT